MNITANTPEAGKVFDKWVLKSGDATIADVNSASTTVTTKAGAATIEATYKDEGVTPAPEYKIIEGANGKWTQKSGTDLKFKANGEISKFTGVKVDGTLLSSDKYTAVSGSTVVTLKDAYLSTLSVGKHTLTVVYNDSECSTEFEIKAASNNGGQTGGNTGDKDNSGEAQSPQTGDSSHLMGWIAALFVSGGVLAVTGVVGARKKKEEVE